jgi:hypothetical protein
MANGINRPEGINEVCSWRMEFLADENLYTQWLADRQSLATNMESRSMAMRDCPWYGTLQYSD